MYCQKGNSFIGMRSWGKEIPLAGKVKGMQRSEGAERSQVAIMDSVIGTCSVERIWRPACALVCQKVP